jgi:hypothetical protein
VFARFGHVALLGYATSFAAARRSRLGPPKPADFPQIAQRPDASVDSLHKFLSTTHATATLPIHMANPSLTEEQTNKIIDFILSLRTKR